MRAGCPTLISASPLPLLLCCALLLPTEASAQQPPQADEPPGQIYYDQARGAYRQRDYQQASTLLRQAIQAEPSGARYYIGLARAYFYLEDWEQAVYYYDLYLEHFLDHARQARRSADRESAVRREREEANSHRADRTVPPSAPPSQQAALEAFRQRLATGPILNEENTGAYFFYQTLLRTGYAHPDLQQIHRQLADALVAEDKACFEPTDDSLIPVATVERWGLVHERYRIAGNLGHDTQSDPSIAARILAAQGQIDLVNGNYTQATDRFGQAIEQDPSLLSAYYGLLYALHRQSAYEGIQTANNALALVDRLEQLTRTTAQEHLEMIPLVRSIALADAGRYQDAASLIIEILAPGHLSGQSGYQAPNQPLFPATTPPAPAGTLPAQSVGQPDPSEPVVKPPSP
ncbi:MAG: tetratricopeptide repeat protein [Bradymonadales bacterium]|nr:tetratricopeptide repeat protein [Bradymonadales bacterium]